MSGKDDDDRPYPVGYGKPPRATRFQPGRSGNPKGRPKGARGVAKVLAAALAQQVTVTEAGRTSRISKREALVVSLVTRAIKGDMRAAAHVLQLIAAHEAQGRPEEKGLTIHVVDAFDDPA